MARRFTAAAYIIILLAALLLRFKPAYLAAQFEPVPDALEYALSSLSIYQHVTFAFTVNHMAYPPRYPFGFPLLLAPAFAVFGPQPQNAIYASLAFSLGLIVAAMLAAQRLFGPLAGVTAGAVLAVSPPHVTNGQQIMGDSAAAFLLLLATVLVIRAVQQRAGAASLLAAGFLAGLAVAVNYAHIAGLIALFAAPLLIWRRQPRLAMQRAGLLALAALPWGIALAVYQWLTFGSPLHTGYGFWYNSLYGNLTQSFSLSYLLQAAGGGSPGNLDFYGRMLLGASRNSFYPVLYVLAIVLGVVALLRAGTEKRRTLLVLALVFFASVGLYSVYSYRYRRFVLLAGTLLAITGAGGVQWLWDWAMGRRSIARQAAALVLLALLAATVAWNAVEPARSSYLLRAWLRPAGWQEYPMRYEVGRYLDGHIPNDALVISGIPGPHLDQFVLRDTQRTSMAITREASEYAGSTPGQQWPVADERPDLVQQSIARGVHVCLMDDPDTRGAAGRAIEFLRARFAFVERGRLTPPGRPPVTLFELMSREN